MVSLARVIPVILALSAANVAQAAEGDPYIGCFEAVEIDPMNYIDAGLARKIMARQRERQFENLRVTMKMSRGPDGSVSDVEFLKRSELPELDEVARQVALASRIVCPNAPALTKVVDIQKWSLHLSASENNGRINGVAIADRSISNFRERLPENPSRGQRCDVIRNAQGVATKADCDLEGVCIPSDFDQPAFPVGSYQKGLYGMSVVEGEVDRDGKLLWTKVRRSSGDRRLDRAAVQAFNAATFTCHGPNPDRHIRITYDFGKPEQSSRPPIRRR